MLRLEKVPYFGTVFGNYYLFDVAAYKNIKNYLFLFSKKSRVLCSRFVLGLQYLKSNVSKFLIYFIEHHNLQSFKMLLKFKLV